MRRWTRRPRTFQLCGDSCASRRCLRRSELLVSLSPDGRAPGGRLRLRQGISEPVFEEICPDEHGCRSCQDLRRRYQGQGIGKSLLQDAIRRSLSAADLIGVRALLVHAIDQTAVTGYSRFGFKESPTDPLHLMILIKDLRRSIAADAHSTFK